MTHKILLELKQYLAKELSKSYNTKGRKPAVFEPNEKIRIEQKAHAGDVTRFVYYVTKDPETDKETGDFIGYISFMKKREDKKPPYALCIANGEDMTLCRKASDAASIFSSRSMGKIEEIIQSHENKSEEHPLASKIDHTLHEHHHYI